MLMITILSTRLLCRQRKRSILGHFDRKKQSEALIIREIEQRSRDHKKKKQKKTTTKMNVSFRTARNAPVSSRCLTSNNEESSALVVPKKFQCALTKRLMRDPVMTVHGHNFEKEFIVQWFALGKRFCPVTGKPLSCSGMHKTTRKQICNSSTIDIYRSLTTIMLSLLHP